MGGDERCGDARQGQAAGLPPRDPDRWKTGAEPMTAAQRSYLGTLATEAGVTLGDLDPTKAEAAKKIDELQALTGRGQGLRQ